MYRPNTTSCAALGTDPISHLTFLIRHPGRQIALRRALERVVRQGWVVLDAGCGALGLLAIMAAKLGAARAVGVDLGDLQIARLLAKENGVADRVDFVEGDLRHAPIPVQRCDLLVSMIYRNHPGLDRPQHQLVQRLVERHAHAATVVIPSEVHYSATGYAHAWPHLERRWLSARRTLTALHARAAAAWSSQANRRTAWAQHLVEVERQAGISLSAIRPLIDRSRLLPPTTPIARPRSWGPVGLAPPPGLKALTQPHRFATIDGSSRSGASSYPESVALAVVRPGRMNAVLWRQDLLFDDIVIRRTESLDLVNGARRVAPKNRVILSIRSNGRDGVPMSVEPGVAGGSASSPWSP